MTMHAAGPTGVAGPAGPGQRRVAERRGPRTGVVTLGVVALVAGALAALLLWLGADDRYDDGVSGLARAPVGCETVLDFDEPGEFFVFVETTGRLDQVRGDCDVGGPYDLPEVPEVSVSVVDPDGEPLDVAAVSGVDYDRAGFRGTSLGTIEVAEAADHVVRVESATGQDFAVAVGRDPYDGVGALRVAAVALGALGAVVGLALLVIGLRGGSPGPADADAPSVAVRPVPDEAWYVTSPPTSPPRGPPSAPGDRRRPPASPPARIPGEPLSPGGRPPPPTPGGDEPAWTGSDAGPAPRGPRLAAPGPWGPRRPPLPPPGGRAEPAERDDERRDPWAPPESS